METYHTVMVKVANLQKKAKACILRKVPGFGRCARSSTCTIFNLNELFPLTVRPLRARCESKRSAKASKKVVLKPKYRDPATGKT